MSSVFELINKEEIKPFVRFERVAFEDKQASLQSGHYVAQDIDMAYVTPPYSKDVMKYKVKSWMAQLEQDLKNKRISQQWVNDYKKAYEYWVKGQELPVDGIPIKGWGVISPAQQETLTRMHILTVEQLAAVNDEGMRRIGIGAVDMKTKAVTWLKSLKKSGAVTIEMAELKAENTRLQSNLLALEEKLSKLESSIKIVKMQPQMFNDSTEISADDIIGTD